MDRGNRETTRPHRSGPRPPLPLSPRRPPFSPTTSSTPSPFSHSVSTSFPPQRNPGVGGGDSFEDDDLEYTDGEDSTVQGNQPAATPTPAAAPSPSPSPRTEYSEVEPKPAPRPLPSPPRGPHPHIGQTPATAGSVTSRGRPLEEGHQASTPAPQLTDGSDQVRQPEPSAERESLSSPSSRSLGKRPRISPPPPYPSDHGQQTGVNPSHTAYIADNHSQRQSPPQTYISPYTSQFSPFSAHQASPIHDSPSSPPDISREPVFQVVPAVTQELDARVFLETEDPQRWGSMLASSGAPQPAPMHSEAALPSRGSLPLSPSMSARQASVDEAADLGRMLYGPADRSSPLSPVLPLSPRRAGGGVTHFSSPSLSSPIPVAGSSVPSPAVDHGFTMITGADVHALQMDMLAVKQKLAECNHLCQVLESDYAAAGFIIDSVYTGLSLDNAEPDISSNKPCRYKDIVVPRIGTACEYHEGVDPIHGLCTHPPWQGELTISKITLDTAASYYRGLFHRAKFTILGLLKTAIDSTIARISIPWPRSNGTPWGLRPVPNVGREE